MPQRGFASILVILLLSVVMLGGGVFIYQKYSGSSPSESIIIPSPTPKLKACTLEAKLCPDGTSVGRTGPSCEFTPCPTSESTSSPDISTWKTYVNKVSGFSIKYPKNWFNYVLNDIPNIVDKQVIVLSNEKINNFKDLSKNGVMVAIYGGSGGTIYTENIYKLNGHTFYRIDSSLKLISPSPDSWFDQVLIQESGMMFTLVTKDSKTHRDNRPIFDQILSTFKFLP